VHAIAHGLERALGSNMKVLWLLSGGSNIAIEMAVLGLLEHATPQNLIITLIDERFVPLDDPNSNWRQLLDAGLTDQKATLVPVVTDPSLSLSMAAQVFSDRLVDVSKEIDVVIGQFGIGPDGHTAGILPHSEGVHEKKRLVLGYEGPDFKRITTTPVFFKQIDLAVAVAMSQEKRQVVEQLPAEISPEDQPAQLLKLAKELIIYTDQQVGWG
jgi:6-phosphogluconolactonase/glucosamine-6-phosphate isomerase/deaminase